MDGDHILACFRRAAFVTLPEVYTKEVTRPAVRADLWPMAVVKSHHWPNPVTMWLLPDSFEKTKRSKKLESLFPTYLMIDIPQTAFRAY